MQLHSDNELFKISEGAQRNWAEEEETEQGRPGTETHTFTHLEGNKDTGGVTAGTGLGGITARENDIDPFTNCTKFPPKTSEH